MLGGGVNDRRTVEVCRRIACEFQNVGMFTHSQAEGACDCFQHLSRWPDFAGLLEPRVPRDAHTEEERDFLAAQTYGAAPWQGRKRQLGTIDLLPT